MDLLHAFYKYWKEPLWFWFLRKSKRYHVNATATYDKNEMLVRALPSRNEVVANPTPVRKKGDQEYQENHAYCNRDKHVEGQ